MKRNIFFSLFINFADLPNTPSYPSLRPVATVESAVGDCLGKVLLEDRRRALEVGNRAGDLQDAAVCAGRERETLHRHAEHVKRTVVGLGILVYHAFRHLCVAVDALAIPETLLLYPPRGDDTLADCRGGLTCRLPADVLERHGRYLALDVYPIDKNVVRRMCPSLHCFKWIR